MAKGMTIKEMASKGGKARARNLTPAQLTAIGKKGAAARWSKRAGTKE